MGWMFKAPLTVLLLASVALAGCSDGDGRQTDDFDDFGVKATDDTGIVVGVVVDASIQPIANAQVVLEGPTPANTTTDADGVFAFGDLEPGDYFVRAAKLGYVTAQSSQTVEAGVSDPEKLVIRLETDTSTKVGYEEFVFDGFIECSGTFVAVGIAVCSVPNLASQDVCNISSGQLCLGNFTNDRFLATYPLSGVPMFAQSEMVWDSTQAAGSEMALMYSYDDDCDPYYCDHEVGGTSPLLLQANQTAIDTIGMGPEQDLMIRVFNKGLQETDPCVPNPTGGETCAPGGGLGLTFEQGFTVYTHVFYGYEPPEGWRFTEDDQVPTPE